MQPLVCIFHCMCSYPCTRSVPPPNLCDGSSSSIKYSNTVRGQVLMDVSTRKGARPVKLKSACMYCTWPASSPRCPQLQFVRTMFHMVTARRLKHCTNHAAALDRADANQSILAGMPESWHTNKWNCRNKPQTADTLTLRPRDAYHSIHHNALLLGLRDAHSPAKSQMDVILISHCHGALIYACLIIDACVSKWDRCLPCTKAIQG